MAGTYRRLDDKEVKAILKRIKDLEKEHKELRNFLSACSNYSLDDCKSQKYCEPGTNIRGKRVCRPRDSFASRADELEREEYRQIESYLGYPGADILEIPKDARDLREEYPDDWKKFISRTKIVR